MFRARQSMTVALLVSAIVGCSSSPSAPSRSAAYTAEQAEGLNSEFRRFKVGQMFLQSTHPTGLYISSSQPTLELSPDRSLLSGAVTVKWAGLLTKANYETDFVVKITPDGTAKLTVTRDTAVIKINPTNLQAAEEDLTKIAHTAMTLSRLGTGREPKVDDVRGSVTFDYWQRLSAITKQGKNLEAATETARTPEQMSAGLREAAAAVRRMRSAIKDLPILNVDTEVVSYASQTVEIFGQADAIIGDFADFIVEAKQFKDHAESLDAGLEAFVRAFLGDPLGKFNETSAQARQLNTRRLQIVDRWKSLSEKTNKLDAQELALRAALAQRYGREFPRLE